MIQPSLGAIDKDALCRYCLHVEVQLGQRFVKRTGPAGNDVVAIDFLRLNPVQAKYWKYLAQIRMKREEWQTAASDWEISHRVEAPKRQSEWMILGDLYTTAVNAPLIGARCYKEAYKDNSAEKGYLSISRVYQTAYRYDEAIKTLDKGIKKNPMSATLLLEKGRVLYEARRYKEAVAALKECVK